MGYSPWGLMELDTTESDMTEPLMYIQTHTYTPWIRRNQLYLISKIPKLDIPRRCNTIYLSIYLYISPPTLFQAQLNLL